VSAQLHRNVPQLSRRSRLPALLWTKLVLKRLWRRLVGVVLVVATVVLVVHLLSLFTGLALGTLAVDVVGTLGLAELVDLAAGKSGYDLLGELVVDLLACEGM